MNIKHKKGFTLIEIIIYITLFSILIGTSFVTAYGLIENSNKLNIKNNVQEEGSFVLRKINWALIGVKEITIPISGITHELKIIKYSNNEINVKLVGSKIKMTESMGPDNFITTENVIVSNLDFELISASGSSIKGVKATAKINGVDFTITKYIRK